MDADNLKILASHYALSKIPEGAILGIGTGSTVDHFIQLLGEKVSSGFKITAIPTSIRTKNLCNEVGIPLSSFDRVSSLDLVIDGADQIAPDLALLKGRGGAFFHEKIVAAASDRMIIIADSSKMVDILGHCAVPLEIEPFGFETTILSVSQCAKRLGLSGSLCLRMQGDIPFLTDGGHYVLDAYWGALPDPFFLSHALYEIPGVLEHGIFINFADLAIVAGEKGIQEFSRVASEKTRDYIYKREDRRG